MPEPTLRDTPLTDWNVVKAAEAAAQVAGLPDVAKKQPRRSKGEPGVHQVVFRLFDGEVVFVFDFAGMSLESTAGRFMEWAALSGDEKIVYVASSYTKSFMADLCEHHVAANVDFLFVPEGGDRFERFDESMAAPDQPEDDSELERRLMEQVRPERPRRLDEAREMVEGYVAEALKKDLSPPEARVEAMRVVAFLETYAKEAGRIDARRCGT